MIPAAFVLAVAAATPGVLTLEDALKTAAAHQPQLMQARANTQVFQARAEEVRAGLLPSLSGNATYTRKTNNFASGSIGNINANGLSAPGPTTDTINFFNFGVSITQPLYDFNQTIDKWRAAKTNAEAQYAGEVNINEQIALNVRTAFFNARATKALVQVAKDTLANQQRHLDQIAGFVKVGTRPEIDLAQARTDFANAKVQLITAGNNYETAKAQLNQSMGVVQPTDYDVADETLAPVDVEDRGIDDLADEAKKGRPDVVAFEKQVQAQKLSVRGAWGGFGPSINASMGLNDAGADINNLAWNWNAGVSVAYQGWSPFLTWASIKEQKALLTGLEAQLELQKQQVRLDVEQARLAVRAAKENTVATAEALVNAQERLRLAEGRYQAGVGNVIELGDAQVALTNAQAQKVQAEYNLATARAQLLKALGRR